MAIPTTTSSVSYTGNASTETAYTIPFPFLDSSHLRVSVTDEDDVTTVLSAVDYAVTRLPDGSAGSLVTAAAVPSTSSIRIKRVVPLTQPTTFPLSGPFSARTAETALDRLLMQVQQVARDVAEIDGVSDETSVITAFGRWDTGKTYAIGDIATGSDNNHYRAKTAHSGANPTADAGANWELVIVDTSVTLNVPARFGTISAAWTFLASAYIGSEATVTIQVADGTYNMGTTRLNLNHPCGARIRLVGDEANAANCVLDFVGLTGETVGTFYEEDWGAIYVHSGHQLGWLNGFTLNGPGVAEYGVAGILAFNGARFICGPELRVADFYAGLAAVNHSYIQCDYVHVSGGGDGNLFVYNGSAMSAQGCISEGASLLYAKAGAMVEHGSALFAPNSTFQENEGTQVACHYGSTLMIAGSTLSVTGALVGVANGVQMIAADNCDLTGVTYTGVAEPLGRIVNHQNYMRFGAHVPFSPSLFGRFQFIAPEAAACAISITQNNVATGYWGFQASSNTLVLANDGATIALKVASSAALGGTTAMTVTGTKTTVPRLNISNLPTSASGLTAGDLWNDSGTLKVA